MQDAKDKLAAAEKLRGEAEKREEAKARQSNDSLVEAYQRERRLWLRPMPPVQTEQAQSSMLEMRLYLEEIQKRDAQRVSEHAEALRKANDRAEAAAMEASQAKEAQALAWREADAVSSRDGHLKEQFTRAQEALLAAKAEAEEYKRAAAESKHKEAQAKSQEADAVASREAAAAAASAEKAAADLRVALSAASSAVLQRLRKRTAHAKKRQRTPHVRAGRCMTRRTRHPSRLRIEGKEKVDVIWSPRRAKKPTKP